jgi:hypothetical protein
MIHMPRRSVTRYFIPLIDVMILMFCIFLLMPALNESEPEDPKSVHRKLEKQIRDLEARINKLQAELAALRKREKLLRKLPAEPQLLEYDPKTKKLYSYEGGQVPPRRPIESEEDARALIERHEQELRNRSPDPDLRPKLYYAVLVPSVASDILAPSQQEKLTYQRWFEGVELKFVRPSGLTP